MPRNDARVDAYISKAKPFAQPVLKRLRAAVHEACPDVEETIKWGHPSLDYKGPMCGMAAFKAYVSFAFWKEKLLIGQMADSAGDPVLRVGKIERVADLPSRATLIRLIRAAADLNERGVKIERKRTPKPPLKVPTYFTAALRKNARALATFKAFPPSHKREYVDWIVQAKRDDTRLKRIDTAISWMAEGKGRNWQYER